jgi:hypothetical protein
VATSAERKARNEGVFREANEQLERGAHGILDGGDDGGLVPFLCECPDLECTKIAMLSLAEYRDVRSTGRGGLAVLGHEDLAIERVVARNDRFVKTEKFGRAGEVHEEASSRGG